MAASEAAVTAVMETLGCQAGTAICLIHHDYLRRDRARGCPVAVAAADAVERIVKAETLAPVRDLADEWDDDYPPKSRVAWFSRELRERADLIEAQP